jgi:hypothetical protein
LMGIVTLFPVLVVAQELVSSSNEAMRAWLGRVRMVRIDGMMYSKWWVVVSLGPKGSG